MKLKIHLILILCLSFCFTIWSQTPNFDWAKKFDGRGDVIIQDVETNSSGRIYVLGTFGDSVDFDPGVGVKKLYSQHLGTMFIMGLTPAGNLSWLKQFTVNTSFAINPQEMVVDTIGNIYIAGSFKATQDFDPATTSYTMDGGQFNEGFLLKLNAQGNLIWAKEFNGDVMFEDIQMDTNQNLYLSGSYQGATDFDPGIQNANFLTVNGSFNGFILKISKNGDYKWVKVLTGPQNGAVNDLKVDNSNGVYYGGYAAVNTDLNPGSPVYTFTTRTAFIGRLDSSGNYLNSAVFQGAGTIFSMLLTPSGIVAAGEYNGQFDLDPSANQQTVTISNQDCGFILKIDTTFSFMWGKTINSTTTSAIYNMRLTRSIQNDFYLFTDFKGTFDFDQIIAQCILLQNFQVGNWPEISRLFATIPQVF